MKRQILIAASAFVLTACQASWATTGVAHLKGTAEGSTISGEVRLTETSDGLTVTADIQGATPGMHGFHIHEHGSCADVGAGAGGHFNPAGAPHGLLAQGGHEGAHAGDLGNIEIGDDGTGTLKGTLPGVTLTAGEKFGVTGRAVILHEKEDDFGQPTGNAGGRIGCGVIETSV